MSGIWQDLLGSTKSQFKLGLLGVLLKNLSGNLTVRNNADSADAEITVSKLNNSGDSIVINSDAAGSVADWKLTLARPASGMASDLTITLPSNAGTPNQVLQTDGSGNLSWVSASSTASSIKDKSINLAYGTTSPVAMFTTGASDVIDSIDIIVDTAFNGTPTMTVGISGTTSKYTAASQVDLTAAATTKFMINPNLPAQGAESLILTYVAGGATAGAARVVVHYATPA
jgi:hypothetical protein